MAAELTVDRLRERVARMMGWRRPEDWPSAIEPVEMANEAGEWLYSMREWAFLRRPLQKVSLLAGQGWIDLPSDFGRMIGDCLPPASGFAGLLKMGSIEEVRDARRFSPLGRAARYIGVIVHTGPDLAGPRSYARLEIGPVPTESEIDAFDLAYRAGWREVADGSDHILCPSWLEACLVEAATAFVGGREHEEDGTVFDRLDRLVSSSLFAAALSRDGAIQTETGPMRGTVGEMFGDGDVTSAYGARSMPIVGGGA